MPTNNNKNENASVTVQVERCLRRASMPVKGWDIELIAGPRGDWSTDTMDGGNVSMPVKGWDIELIAGLKGDWSTDTMDERRTGSCWSAG